MSDLACDVPAIFSSMSSKKIEIQKVYSILLTISSCLEVRIDEVVELS
jgi:hypothetical protein